MTFKTTLLGTAAVFALALPVTAQTADTGVTDMECSGEIVDNVCIEDETAPAAPMEDATAPDTATETPDASAETEADIAAEVEAETDADVAADETMTEPTRDLRDMTAFSGMTVSEIVGMPVESADAEDVGEIDYIFETSEGHDAVIGIGGFLGLGEYTVSVPLGAFTLDTERNVLVLDGFTEDELTAMPEIDESELEALPGEYVIG